MPRMQQMVLIIVENTFLKNSWTKVRLHFLHRFCASSDPLIVDENDKDGPDMATQSTHASLHTGSGFLKNGIE